MKTQNRHIDFSAILGEIASEIADLPAKGKVADYIPALARIDPDQYAVSVQTVDGEEYGHGCVDTPFSIQSISKVLTAIMVLKEEDILLWERVGVEPSGNAFDSLVQLEYESGIPRNPFINAGALVVTDELLEIYDDPKKFLITGVQKLSGDDDVNYDTEVATSEYETSDRNRALGHYLKSQGNLKNEVEAVLDLYCHQCSIAMSARSLARSFLFLANDGVIPLRDHRVLSPSQSRRINSVMLTCGFYDQAGEFAYLVGMPGKSGVGGGIVAVVPGHLSIAVWSPRLNEHGNSVFGVETLRLFTDKTGLAIF